MSLLLRLLKDLNYHQLSSQVSYQSNGDTTLKVSIKGKSPALSAQREVNFNYTHQENLLQLLKSLRITHDVETQLDRLLGGKDES